MRRTTIGRALAGAEPGRDQPGGPAVLLDARVLSEIATGLWRARNRLVDPDTDQPLPDTAKIHRHVQAVFDTLTEAGVEVQSHLHSPYDSGQAINAIAFQEIAGIQQETVIDVVRPSVYVGDRQIQRAEVVIGVPVREQRPPEQASESDDKSDGDETGENVE